MTAAIAKNILKSSGKMRKIKFEIKYRDNIESGKWKVVTRDGLYARIICWDASPMKPIVALVEGDIRLMGCGGVTPLTYTSMGNFLDNGTETENDLFIITDEPEITKFQEKVHEILFAGLANDIQENPTAWLGINDELLKLAKEELEKDYILIDKDKYPDICEDFFNRGKQAVLNDLPKWRKVTPNTGQTILYKGFCKGQNYLEMDGYRIMLADLEKLPKEK